MYFCFTNGYLYRAPLPAYVLISIGHILCCSVECVLLFWDIKLNIFLLSFSRLNAFAILFRLDQTCEYKTLTVPELNDCFSFLAVLDWAHAFICGALAPAKWRACAILFRKATPLHLLTGMIGWDVLDVACERETVTARKPFFLRCTHAI